MKSIFTRLLALCVLPVLALSLAACGGGHDKDQDRDRKPAFDVSGTWLSNMDGVYLGKFNFKMSSKGDLSGTLVTDRGAKAKVAGSVAAYKAEFTLTFTDAAYLVSVTFKADRSNASGAVVDNGGNLHPLVLYK